MLYEKDATLDLSWTSPRYAELRPTADGRWRVLVVNDVSVGVVWTDNEAGAGVVWLEQPDEVNRLRRHFGEGFEAGTTALMAYQIAVDNLGLWFYDEETGKLEGVNDELQAMMDDRS